MGHAQHADLEERLLHRMLFFTDAVFAIAMTLLVLELKPPEEPSGLTVDSMRSLIGHIGIFAMSFALIGVFWVAHLNTTRRLAHFDWPTAVVNLLFLLPVCLIPFAAAWFGESLSASAAWAFYCWVLIATSATNMVLVAVCYRGGGKLIAGGSPRGELLYRLSRASAPGVAFAIGLGLLASGYVIAAHFCWPIIGLVFAVSEGLLKPKAQPRTA